MIVGRIARLFNAVGIYLINIQDFGILNGLTFDVKLRGSAGELVTISYPVIQAVDKLSELVGLAKPMWFPEHRDAYKAFYTKLLPEYESEVRELDRACWYMSLLSEDSPDTSNEAFRAARVWYEQWRAELRDEWYYASLEWHGN